VPTAVLWLVLCVQRGALQGLQRYRLVGVSLVGEAAARLVFGLILVGVGLDIAGAYLGTTMSIASMAALLGYALHKELDTAPPGLTRPLGVAAATALPITLVFVFGGHLLLGKVFGKDFATADTALPILGVAMAMLAVTYLCVQYLLALHRSRFVLVLVVGALL